MMRFGKNFGVITVFGLIFEWLNQIYNLGCWRCFIRKYGIVLFLFFIHELLWLC